MKEKSVDFVNWNPAPDDLERVYRQRLSYQVAYAEKGETVPLMWPSAERYAKVILYLEKNGLLHRFDEVVAQLRSTYNAEMKRLGLNSSRFGKDDSWIHWDLAKQVYFFLSTDQSAASRHYQIADPLSDERLRDEIISRHLGWEFWSSGGREPWTSNSEVRHLLGPECENSAKDGQPASWALAKLGVLIRSSPL